MYGCDCCCDVFSSMKDILIIGVINNIIFLIINVVSSLVRSDEKGLITSHEWSELKR